MAAIPAHITDVHVDKVLTNLLLGRKSGTNVADQILPPVPVGADVGEYFEWGRNEINIKGLDTYKAPRAKPKEVYFRPTRKPYSLDPHGLSTFIEDRDRDNAEPILAFRERHTVKLRAMYDRVYEKSVAEMLLDKNLYGDNTDKLEGNKRWSVFHNDSVPQVDMQAAIVEVHKRTGVKPNRLVMDWSDFMRFRQHPKIKESIQYVSKTGMDYLNLREIAAYLGVEKIILADALENTENPGQPEDADYIWKGHALLYYASNLPAKDSPSFGYKFYSKKAPFEVLRYRENGEEGEHIYVRERKAPHICMPDAAFFFEDAFATG